MKKRADAVRRNRGSRAELYGLELSSLNQGVHAIAAQSERISGFDWAERQPLIERQFGWLSFAHVHAPLGACVTRH